MTTETNIRKPFADLVALLEANKDKKVASILDAVKELCESKKKDSTIRKDVNGNITHIFCYYHKEWEEVKHYGAKISSHSGYNTMCKIGVNEWTRRQNDMKKAKEAVLTKVASGALKPDQIQAELEKIEKMNNVIIPRAESIKKLEAKKADVVKKDDEAKK
jgi:hypothetical protein